MRIKLQKAGLHADPANQKPPRMPPEITVTVDDKGPRN
jgi:hypothetical protein